MEQIFNKGVSASVRNELPAWKQAVKNGKVIVFAAGNNVRNQPSIHSGLPAHDPNLTKGWLAVVAVDSNQQETIYSNRCGLAADWCLAAPGGGDYPAANGIISTRVGGHFTRMSGTSMAAPHVSGGILRLCLLFRLYLHKRQRQDCLAQLPMMDCALFQDAHWKGVGWIKCVISLAEEKWI